MFSCPHKIRTLSIDFIFSYQKLEEVSTRKDHEKADIEHKVNILRVLTLGNTQDNISD